MQRIFYFLMLIFCVLCSTPAVGGEAKYQGQPVSYWFDQVLKEFSGATNYTGTRAAFQAMGSNAIPFLVNIVETKPTKLAQLGDEVVSKLDDKPNLREVAKDALPSAYRIESARQHAAYVISWIGTNAGAAIPALIKILEDGTEDFRLEQEVFPALLAMGEAGAVAVPRYIEYMKGDAERRISGAYLLGSVGPKAKTAVPLLLEAANETNSQLRLAAARALWKIDRQTNVALRTFVQDLKASKDFTRLFALVSLAEMGPAAREAGPALQAALADSDQSVRRAAEEALQKIAPDLLQSSKDAANQNAAENLKKIIQKIQEGEFPERFRALELVSLFGPDAKSAIPVLIEVLKGKGVQARAPFGSIGLMNSRREAAVAIAEIGPDARAAVPALTQLVSEGRDSYIAIYCKALGRIGADAISAVPALEKSLTNENPGIRLAAATALTGIAPTQCSNAVAVLQRLQRDPALATVWTVGSTGIARQSSQKDFDNPGSRFFRHSASVALWKLGLEKEPLVDTIIQELGNKYVSDEISYFELLADIGPTARPALPLLIKSLNQKGGSIRVCTAARAIRRIDPDEAAKLGLPGLLAVP